MPKYVVTHAWEGVKVGDVIEREQLHPALIFSVKPLPAEPKQEAKQEPKKPKKG